MSDGFGEASCRGREVSDNIEYESGGLADELCRQE